MKNENMEYLAMEFPFQNLDISIEFTKYWNRNSNAKQVKIPNFHLFPTLCLHLLFKV